MPADGDSPSDSAVEDQLRQAHHDEGQLTVDVVNQREGVFDDFGPVDVGPTNAVEVEREFGAE